MLLMAIETPKAFFMQVAVIINTASKIPENIRRWRAWRTSGIGTEKEKNRRIKCQKDKTRCADSYILKIYLIQLLNRKLISLIPISASNRS